MMEARAVGLSLPALEDANAIQVGLMRIQKALIEDTISTKKAGLLLYSMQLALQNVGQTTFGQVKTEELVRETVDEEEAASNQYSAFSQSQKQNQRPFTTEATEGAEEDQGLPRINADKRRSEEEEHQGLPLVNADGTDWAERDGEYRRENEFVPVPGGYGFERVRLRIEPLGGEKRPVQAAIAPGELAEMRQLG
jgi:hypothetical protein